MRQDISIRIGGPITPAVKMLLIINGVVFFLQYLLKIFIGINPEMLFGISYVGIANHMYWQLFTYMFLHGGILHILFNMLALWMFAGDLENRWGTKRFLFYYVVSGIGAGLFIAGMNAIAASSDVQYAYIPTVGASGAIYALLLAYGITWPNREVLLYFILPIKMKWLVLLFGLIEFFGTLNSLSPNAGNISHIGHLGGLFTGAIIILFWKFAQGKPSFFKKRKETRRFTVINNRDKAKEIIDRLLDKIAREGMNSLSPKERSELEWARRNYYPGEDDTIH